MQDEAFDKLYELSDQMSKCKDPQLKSDWLKLQASDHFYYMCTKWFSDGDVHEYFNPYPSPYEAFINYMNVLSDFKIRLEEINDNSSPVKVKSLKPSFEELELYSVARLKKVLSNIEIEDIAQMKEFGSNVLVAKLDKYLTKKKQKELNDLGEVKAYSKKKTDALLNRIQSIK